MSYVHGNSIIKIALADDDELLLDLLPPFIDSIEDCKVVVQAHNGKELLDKLRSKPDTHLVLMDIKMPEMDGIETAISIKKEYPEMKILFTSIFANELSYCRMIMADGDGFIRKGSSASDLKRAIMELMKNGKYFRNGVAAMNLNFANRSKKAFKANPPVSDEEITFLKLACTGLTYEAIAGRMKCNIRHLDYIRQGLFEKFEVHNRAELALLAYNGGLFA